MCVAVVNRFSFSARPLTFLTHGHSGQSFEPMSLPDNGHLRMLHFLERVFVRTRRRSYRTCRRWLAVHIIHTLFGQQRPRDMLFYKWMLQRATAGRVLKRWRILRTEQGFIQ